MLSLSRKPLQFCISLNHFLRKLLNKNVSSVSGSMDILGTHSHHLNKTFSNTPRFIQKSHTNRLLCVGFRFVEEFATLLLNCVAISQLFKIYRFSLRHSKYILIYFDVHSSPLIERIKNLHYFHFVILSMGNNFSRIITSAFQYYGLWLECLQKTYTCSNFAK